MDAIAIAGHYYDAFRQQSDFSEVPLADQMVFQGPSGTLEGADTFRAVVAGLAQQLKGIEIRHQLRDGDSVLSVYDFDLGLPDGPVPMAEILHTSEGAIQRIELLFDSARLAAPAGQAG